MRGARVGILALWLLAAAAVVSCGRSAGALWAAEAAGWLAAYDEALAAWQGLMPAEDPPIDQAAFYAPGVVADLGMVGGQVRQGRESVLALDRWMRSDPEVGYEAGEAYLDAHAFVRSDTFVHADDAGDTVVSSYLTLSTVDPQVGIVHTHAFGNAWIAAHGRQREEGSVSAQRVADRVAAEYVRDWSEVDFCALRDLYSADATVRDTTYGVDVTGRESIVALADPHSTAAAELQPVADLLADDVVAMLAAPPEEPAVFVYLDPNQDGDLAQVLLLQHSLQDCPGRSAILLQVDRLHQITAERRFHAIDSVRACGGADVIDDGWWTGLQLPGTLSERATGHLETPAGPVQIRNGTPELEMVAEWALGRFPAAGLPSPEVSVIDFDPYNPRCADLRGYCTWSHGDAMLVVCADASGIAWTPPEDHDPSCPQRDCPAAAPSQRHLLLHELSHAWMATHLDQHTRDAFTAHVGATSWDNGSTPWAQRGVERAADTLAWGLSGNPETRLVVGNPDCSTLADSFHILTDADPITRCL